MEFLSLSRRRSSARNVLSDEERGETDVFAGYLENGVMMIPKRLLLTLIFACLCFKKSLLIKNYKKVTNKIYKKKKSTLQHLDKRGGEGHIEIN